MSPVVLGIDTSSSWCSAALLRGTDCFVRRAEVGNAHSERLLAMVDDVLGEAGLPLGRCDALAFSAGPGSFTGLRVACAVAQGLAFGASLRVAPIGTLEAIAHAARRGTVALPRSILVVQDARMGEVYWALVRVTGEGQRTEVGPALAHPAALRDALASIGGERPFDVGCGNGWAIHAALLEGLVAHVVPGAMADAVDVAELGAIAVREGRLVPPESAAPVYVRNDVARTTAEREALASARLPAAVD